MIQENDRNLENVQSLENEFEPTAPAINNSTNSEVLQENSMLVAVEIEEQNLLINQQALLPEDCFQDYERGNCPTGRHRGPCRHQVNCVTRQVLN